MENRIRMCPAPSILADSSMAAGRPSKNVFMTNMLYCEMMNGTMIAHSVFSSPSDCMNT